ncbi:ATP-binding protein [Saccharothrix syringae]|nr:BTAD domain-containing putative transcriptional regulator [Saccharothrix syringae]
MRQSHNEDHDERDLVLVDEALSLWRGPALSGADGAWAEAMRRSLERERWTALLHRNDVALRLGHHEALVAEVAVLVDENPLDERLAGQFVLALYRCGRQADALRHYQVVQRRLAEELGVDPGPQLRELHQRILTTDPTLTPPGTDATTAAGRPPAVPRQLPAPPRCFTGRAEHLADLDAALGHRGTAVISAIGGAGGIGKTWLALTWAYRHLDRFPDGQLFVDLRGFSPEGTPTDPAVAVRGFLDALGVAPDRIPVDPESRSALYRSLVSGKRMLIVLDNAATTDQVVPLLPGGDSCTVLVTSRHRLHGLTARHGAHPLSLGVLTDAESRALLIATLGPDHVANDDHATAELIALCGGFPLALGLVAARTQFSPPLSEVVAELRESGLDALDADDPTASLPTVLSWSLRHLTERQRTAFALLGIAPGPDIGLPAATNLTGLPERETRAVLRALADSALIDPHPGGRYALHDLVRAYAATLAQSLPEPARVSALQRVVDFYLHTAHTADRLLAPHRTPLQLDPRAPGTHIDPLPDRPAAMAWFDNEHANLLAALHTATTRHWHHTAWQLAWALNTFQYRRGYLQDQLVVWRVALDAATHSSDSAVRTTTHRLLGIAYADLGRHEEAIEHLYQALDLAGHHLDQVLIHLTLSWAWAQRGDDQRALSHANHSLDLVRALDQPRWEARALNAVGWYSARLGVHDTARTHCRAALALHRQHHDHDGEATALDSLGYIDHHTGRHRSAIRHYRRALDLYRTLDHTPRMADTLDNLGHPYAALGQHDHACEVWREARELYREQGREADAERVQRQLDALGEP